MIKFLFRILVVVLLAALVYGLILIYREKAPEDRAALRRNLGESAAVVARTTAGALLKTYGKVREMIVAPEPGKTPEP